MLGFDRLLGRLEAACLAAMVAAITGVAFAQVVSRYAMGDPIIWSEEVARYLFVWITLVGAAAAVRTHAHFGLDILRRYFPGMRTALGAVTMLVVAALQISPALQVRMHWAYLALPVGAGLALWHVLAHWMRTGIGAHPLDKPEEGS